MVSLIALEAVKKIDAIFENEREINSLSAEQQLAFRREHVAPLVKDFEDWMSAERTKLLLHAEIAKGMDYRGLYKRNLREYG